MWPVYVCIGRYKYNDDVWVSVCYTTRHQRLVHLICDNL